MTGILICDIIIYLTIFILGACIFSFLNVVVYRVPKKMSFVKGTSICPACNHRLGAKDLVPIGSYLLLKGKCRYCGTKIGSRDTWVELLGGIEAVFLAYYFENYQEAITIFAFFCVLTIVTFLDIDTMEIADGCHVAILILAVIGIFTMPQITILSRLIGMFCISVPMLLLAMLVPGAFGGGDIKLMAAGGFFLGWKLVLVSTFLGILFGGCYGIYLLAKKKVDKKTQFAFGPFLCLGMAIGVIWGMQILDWYINFMF